ncbi:DUF3841 domain-containing protein [Cupriavidus sp. JZ107]
MLATGKPFRTDPAMIDPYFLPAYDWLVGKMLEHCGPRPEGCQYPVWAWHQWLGPERARPDLRFESVRGRERGVLLTLDIDPDRALLSDFEAWHFPLNNWFLGDEAATEGYIERCRLAGLSDDGNDPLPDSELHALKQRSWDAIFTANGVPCVAGPDVAGPNCVQATFWEIRPIDVREAVRFGPGQRLEKLSAPLA